jgi:hypothetical protein
MCPFSRGFGFRVQVGNTKSGRCNGVGELEIGVRVPLLNRKREWRLGSVGWYVSNVSIIFDAPCLFLHHFLLFRYTLWHFYAFSGTNLLTSCHSASSLFSAVFVFQKWYTGNILGIGRNKFLKSYFTWKLPDIWREEGEGPPGALT